MRYYVSIDAHLHCHIHPDNQRIIHQEASIGLSKLLQCNKVGKAPVCFSSRPLVARLCVYVCVGYKIGRWGWEYPIGRYRCVQDMRDVVS